MAVAVFVYEYQRGRIAAVAVSGPVIKQERTGKNHHEEYKRQCRQHKL